MTDEARDIIAQAKAEFRGQDEPDTTDLAETDAELSALTAAGFHLHRWQDISEAKKDGTTYLAQLASDVSDRTGRDDLKRWNGQQVHIRHGGLAEDGFDIGWGLSAPVGHGGFPDDWFVGVAPLPPAPPEPGL